MEDIEKLRTREALCALLVKAALVRHDLSMLEDAVELDSDLQVTLTCAVSTAHNLEIHIMNSITIE